MAADLRRMLIFRLFYVAFFAKYPFPAMKLKPYLSILTSFFITLSVFAQAVLVPQKYKSEVDKRVIASPGKVQYYVKLRGTEKPFKIPKPNYWPRDVEFNYSLFYDEKGRLIYAVKEVEPEQGGGWTLLYAYYFLPDGNTVATHKYATFFHSICAGNDVIKEIDINYYDKNFKLLDRDHSLITDTGRRLDSLQCEHPHHFLHSSPPTKEVFLKENGFVK